MFFFIASLWFFRTIKAVLFWLYLWQLKEYHIGRFFDHFRTDKGKKIFANPLFIIKVIFIPGFFLLPVFVFFALIFIYIFEALKVLIDVMRKRTKRPILTSKTIVLLFLSLLTEVLFIFLLKLYVENILTVVFLLLLFDVLAPVIVSFIVLLLQPLAVFARNRIIKRAKEKRNRFKNLLVIGITGSYGKTSTKEFLAAILSEKLKILKTKEHQNSEVGISQCILNDLKEEHEIFIAEMGAYNKGGIKLLCDIVKPKIGMVTGVNEQHLATFGNMENLLSAEGGEELIKSLPEDGMAFFNAKNEHCRNLYQKTTIKKFLYGENAAFSGGENILGAMAVAKELGMTDEEISRVCEKIDNKFPGIKIKKGINGLSVIDATYSANPDGVIAHLEYLKTLSKSQGKIVIVMPCLIELGKASVKVHREIGKKIGEVCDLAIITTLDKFKEIKETVGSKAMFMDNPKEIFEKVKSFCKEGDVVLLESRVSHSLERTKQLIDLLSC